jgi:hypothetical protein
VREWEKDTDARRRRRYVNRGINPFPVAIWLIIVPAMLIAVAVMPTSSVLITAIFPVFPAITVISEGRHHVYATNHCG